MPYKLYKKDGQVCVRNSDTGESKGCSDSREKAVAHMRALYAAENKERIEKELDPHKAETIDLLIQKAIDDFEQEEDQEPETEESNIEKEDKAYFGVYYSGATSYSELEDMMEAEEKAAEIGTLIHRFPTLADNIMNDPTIDDKESAIQTLAQELGTRISSLKKEKAGEVEQEETPPVAKKEKQAPWFKMMLKAVYKMIMDEPEEEDQNNVMIWKEKETGRWKWITRYSNNFRDRDFPPEIISEASHKRFVDLVDKGKAPYPEFWLWHVKDWSLGKADWLAYDDSGFALAAGYFHPGREAIAEWLSTKENVRVSHGMPPNTVKRDKNDPTIITQHESREISVLPDWSAANELTGFMLFNPNDEHKEAKMALPEKKRKSLIEEWGMPSDLVDQLEKLNSTDEQKGVQEGLERKEKDADQPEVEAQEGQQPEANTSNDETPPEDNASNTESETSTNEDKSREESQDSVLTTKDREEIADAVASVLKPTVDQVEAITNVIKGLDDRLSALEKSDEEKIEKTLSSSPVSSLTAMLQKSVVGSDKTKVDEDDPDLQSKPKEKEAPANGRTGIGLIDSLLAGESKQPAQRS